MTDDHLRENSGDVWGREVRERQHLAIDRGIIDRYDVVMRHTFHALGLTQAERGFIGAVLGKSTPFASISVVTGLSDELLDAMRSDALVDEWGIDRESFTRKVRALTTADRCSIVEAHERGALQRGEWGFDARNPLS
jgi:hypothetical protein